MSQTDGPPKGDGQEPLPREFLILLNPDDQINQRVDSRAFQDLVGAVLDVIKKHFSRLPARRGFDLQVACAILPGGKLLTEIQTSPPEGLGDIFNGLREQMMTLPLPRVIRGPVAFASRDLIRGGCPESELAFAFPFSSLTTPGESRPLDEVLMAAGGVEPQVSGWARLKRKIGLG